MHGGPMPREASLGLTQHLRVHSPKALAESGLARFPERLTSPHCALSSGSSFLTSCSSLNVLFPNSKVSQEGKEKEKKKVGESVMVIPCHLSYRPGKGIQVSVSMLGFHDNTVTLGWL